MWRRRRRWENNSNVVMVVYSFTIHEAVFKKKVECRVDVGSLIGSSISPYTVNKPIRKKITEAANSDDLSENMPFKLPISDLCIIISSHQCNIKT